MIGFDQHQDNNRYDDMKEDVNFLFLMSQSTTKLAEGFLKAVPGITTKPTNVINRTLTTSAKEMEEIRDEIIMINKTNPGPLIVVNLLPGVAREDKAEVDYIVQCQKDTVFFCLEILKLLSKLNIHKTTLGVVIEKSMLMANDKAETLNFPIATAIIGLARTAALEQSSVNVLYADIDLELTQSQYSTVLQFFCKRNSGTELLVRKNGCFLPKLERVQLTHDSNEEMVVSAAALLPSKHQPKYLSYSPSRERFALKLDATLLPPGKNDVEMNVSYVSSFSSDITPLLENLKKKKGTSFLKFAVGKVSSAGDAAKETFTHDTQIMACFDGIMVQTSMTFEADQVFVVPSTITAPQVSTLLPPLVNSYHILKKTVFNLPEDQNVLILLGNEEIDLSVFLIILAKALKLNVAFCGSFRIELMEKFNIKKWSYHEVLPFINNPKPLFDFVFCPTNVSDVIMLAVSKMLKPDGQFIILDCSNGNDPTSVPVPKTCSCMRLNALEVKYINPKNVHVEWEKCVEILETSGLFSLVLALPCSVIRISDTVQGAEYSQVGFQALKLNQTDEGSITLQRPSLDIFGMRRNVCYLVIGGAGGFGFETVKWLIRRGAKFVIVCGRSTATVATDEVSFYSGLLQ